MSAEAYFSAVQQLFDKIRETQMSAIKKAANMVADTIKDGGMVFGFGTGHSHMIAEEIFGRAGGFIAVRAILEPALMVHENDTKATYLERLSGLAGIYLENQPIEKGDLLIIASNSGRNAVPIEMALEAKKRGIKTIGLTSVAHSKSTPSRHFSGKKLFEVVDLVLDNCGDPGDAAITIQGSSIKAGATSTIAGALIINAVMVEAVAELVRRGITPAVMFSSNNADTKEALYNSQVRSEFARKMSERIVRMEQRSWANLADKPEFDS